MKALFSYIYKKNIYIRKNCTFILFDCSTNYTSNFFFIYYLSCITNWRTLNGNYNIKIINNWTYFRFDISIIIMNLNCFIRAFRKVRFYMISLRLDLISFNKVDSALKGVFAKNEMGYRLNAIKKRF